VAADVKRVLIVDDSAEDRFLLRRTLGLMSYQVEIIEARTVEEAIRAIRSQHVDVVLMDQKLPNGKGTEAIADLRLAGRTEPILLITGAPSPDDRREALRAGAQAYLGKEECSPSKVEETINDSEARAEALYRIAARRARAMRKMDPHGSGEGDE